MFEAFPELAEIKAIGFYLLISIMRPLGLLFTFGLMNFVSNRATMIRVGVAIALAAPIALGNQANLLEIFLENRFIDRLFLAFKELLVGLALGFIASLPFYGFKYAGAVIDNYRGEAGNALKFEGNEQITTLGLLFYVATALVFISSDGLWHLFGSFYATYDIWPLGAALPALSLSGYVVLLEQVSAMFLTMLLVGLPLLFLLFLTEFLLIIGSRLARRFGLNNFSFIAKNISLVLLLPVYIMIVTMIADARLGEVFLNYRNLEAVFE